MINCVVLLLTDEATGRNQVLQQINEEFMCFFHSIKWDPK